MTFLRFLESKDLPLSSEIKSDSCEISDKNVLSHQSKIANHKLGVFVKTKSFVLWVGSWGDSEHNFVVPTI